MNDRSPYQAPDAAVRDAPEAISAHFRWRRVLAFGALLYATVALLAISSGLSMGWWEMYGADLVQATDNARIVRRIAYCIFGFAIYVGFLLPIARRRLVHVAGLFLAYQLLSLAVSLAVYKQTVAEALPWPSLAVHVLVALAAVIITSRLDAPRPA